MSLFKRTPTGIKIARNYSVGWISKIYFTLICFSLTCTLRVSASEAEKPFQSLMSAEEFKLLAEQLSHKVDIFESIWSIDPNAKIFAGSTRDYLYWLLGKVSVATSRRELDEIIGRLNALPVIEFRQIVSPDSDLDVMSEQFQFPLDANEFGIRKIDRAPPNRFDQSNELGRSEFNQGYIASEKIILGKKGFVNNPQYGDGLSEIFSGQLSITFQDNEEVFWNTYYASQGLNHPVLLALRYLRIIAQDYFRRWGDDYPDFDLLLNSISPQNQRKITEHIKRAASGKDKKFDHFIRSPQGLKWLNGSLQKAFRSFSNPTAAHFLFSTFGVQELISAYGGSLKSINDYLLRKNFDRKETSERFKKFDIQEDEISDNLSAYLSDLKLFHGTGNEENLRGILYQGFLPTSNGTAGDGIYGVSYNSIEFAKDWKSSGDNIIEISLSQQTRIADISRGKGKLLFDKFLKSSEFTEYSKSKKFRSSTPPEDIFADYFGFDVIKYPYHGVDAFVLKNAGVIIQIAGVYKKPKPFAELLETAAQIESAIVNGMKASDINLKTEIFFKELWTTPLRLSDKNRLASTSRRLFELIVTEDYDSIVLSLGENQLIQLLSILKLIGITDSKIFEMLKRLVLKDRSNFTVISAASTLTAVWPTDFQNIALDKMLQAEFQSGLSARDDNYLDSATKTLKLITEKNEKFFQLINSIFPFGRISHNNEILRLLMNISDTIEIPKETWIAIYKFAPKEFADVSSVSDLTLREKAPLDLIAKLAVEAVLDNYEKANMYRYSELRELVHSIRSANTPEVAQAVLIAIKENKKTTGGIRLITESIRSVDTFWIAYIKNVESEKDATAIRNLTALGFYGLRSDAAYLHRNIHLLTRNKNKLFREEFVKQIKDWYPEYLGSEEQDPCKSGVRSLNSSDSPSAP